MEQDNIIFEDIHPSDNGKRWNNYSGGGSSRPHVVPGRYQSLYSELLDKCNPARFMSQYDHDKIEMANSIYTQVRMNHPNNLIQLQYLRKKAINELGVEFSTEQKYEELKSMCNPSRYSGTSKFTTANNLYNEVLKNADNIERLEEIRDRAKAAFKTNEIKTNGKEAESNIPEIYIFIGLAVLIILATLAAS